MQATTIHGLIIDDSRPNIDFIAGRLDRHFKKAGWHVEWQKATDPDKGQELLGAGSDVVNLVIIDLLFERSDLPDQNEPRGLELISEAVERHPNAYVLAISNGDLRRPNLFDDARERGAHRSVRRNEFTVESKDNSPEAIAAAIRTHLLHSGAVSLVAVHAEPDDPGVQSLLHEVGPQTLAQLHRGVLAVAGQDTAAMEVTFLAPGASGAAVCTVKSDVDHVGTVRYVMKVSRDVETLTREAQRGALASTVLPHWLFVRPQPERPVGPVNAWYGLGVPLVDRARTLRAWLGQDPPEQLLNDVLVSLFVEGLGPTYAESGREEDCSALALMKLPHFRQRLVLQALDELGGALTRPDGGGLPDIAELRADIEAFVFEGRPRDVLKRELPRQTTMAYAHGDLHGGNILVCESRRPTPTLIDASEFERTHWATDPARLAVDLLMRTVDAGAESLFFSRFASWREVARRVGAREPAPTSATDVDGPRAALAAVHWIGTNLPRFCPAVDADPRRACWEWHAALATYLLRASYQPDVPGPKRALALVAADDQLAAATQALRA